MTLQSRPFWSRTWDFLGVKDCHSGVRGWLCGSHRGGTDWGCRAGGRDPQAEEEDEDQGKSSPHGSLKLPKKRRRKNPQ